MTFFMLPQREARVSADNRAEVRRIIKQQRTARGLTLGKLAIVSGLSPSHLCRIEKGERFPSARTLWKIARPLGMDETELLLRGGYPPIPVSTEAERPRGLKTRVFELCNGKYKSFYELARAMGVSPSLVYRARQGKRGINEKFIIGAVKAFPGYKLDDLFYVVPDESGDLKLGVRRERPRQIVKASPTPQKPDLSSKAMLTIRDVARLLNVHINTVRRWSNQGMLKRYRIGSRGDRRFRREDVDAFLKEREIE
jgi:excisionase family DNA binding protein